jgi:glycosyltransferase involved in cell wall biosynthesis
MRVVWVSFAPLRKTAAGFTSDLASVRYRLTIPTQAIPGSRVTYLGPGANRRTLLERFAGAEAAVFGKLFDRALVESALELAAELRKRGVRVIADYCDDHFLHPGLGPAYRALANGVDAVVASTPALAEVVRGYTTVRVSVVTDPVEGKRGEPSASLSRPLNLLWFGHPSNLDTLAFGLSQLEKADFSLTIVTSPGKGGENLGQRFRPWSTETVFEELRRCDAVIIPSNAHDPRKAVKSPNRFTESVWAGRFVVAHPLPAYEALAAYGWVGEHLGEGIAWLLEHFEEAKERVRSGQEAVAREFSPEAIGRAWQTAITSA